MSGDRSRALLAETKVRSHLRQEFRLPVLGLKPKDLCALPIRPSHRPNEPHGTRTQTRRTLFTHARHQALGKVGLWIFGLFSLQGVNLLLCLWRSIPKSLKLGQSVYLPLLPNPVHAAFPLFRSGGRSLIKQGLDDAM